MVPRARASARLAALAVLLASPAARAGEGVRRGLTLRDGAIGVAYVVRQGPDRIVLRLVFPDRALRGTLPDLADLKSTARIAPPRRLELFDDRGVLGQLPGPPALVYRFWCENDGGAQWRPEVTLTIAPDALARPLRPVRRLGGIAAFVLAYSGDRPSPPRAVKPRGRTYLEGMAADGQPVSAFVWAVWDDAQNCDGGTEKDQWVSILRTGKQDDALRCCGP